MDPSQQHGNMNPLSMPPMSMAMNMPMSMPMNMSNNGNNTGAQPPSMPGLGMNPATATGNYGVHAQPMMMNPMGGMNPMAMNPAMGMKMNMTPMNPTMPSANGVPGQPMPTAGADWRIQLTREHRANLIAKIYNEMVRVSSDPPPGIKLWMNVAWYELTLYKESRTQEDYISKIFNRLKSLRSQPSDVNAAMLTQTLPNGGMLTRLDFSCYNNMSMNPAARPGMMPQAQFPGAPPGHPQFAPQQPNGNPMAKPMGSNPMAPPTPNANAMKESMTPRGSLSGPPKMEATPNGVPGHDNATEYWRQHAALKAKYHDDVEKVHSAFKKYVDHMKDQNETDQKKKLRYLLSYVQLCASVLSEDKTTHQPRKLEELDKVYKYIVKIVNPYLKKLRTETDKRTPQPSSSTPAPQQSPHGQQQQQQQQQSQQQQSDIFGGMMAHNNLMGMQPQQQSQQQQQQSNRPGQQGPHHSPQQHQHQQHQQHQQQSQAQQQQKSPNPLSQQPQQHNPTAQQTAQQKHQQYQQHLQQQRQQQMQQQQARQQMQRQQQMQMHRQQQQQQPQQMLHPPHQQQQQQQTNPHSSSQASPGRTTQSPQQQRTIKSPPPSHQGSAGTAGSSQPTPNQNQSTPQQSRPRFPQPPQATSRESSRDGSPSSMSSSLGLSLDDSGLYGDMEGSLLQMPDSLATSATSTATSNSNSTTTSAASTSSRPTNVSNSNSNNNSGLLGYSMGFSNDLSPTGTFSGSMDLGILDIDGSGLGSLSYDGQEAGSGSNANDGAASGSNSGDGDGSDLMTFVEAL